MKVQTYQGQVGTRVPGRMVVPSTSAMTAPQQAISDLGNTVGQAGGLLAKLAEQRQIRQDNIEAINLFTQYNEELRGIETAAKQAEGSDAFGAYDAHKKAVTDLGRKYRGMAKSERVGLMFDQHAMQAADSSLNQIAHHEAQQGKVARVQAGDNLLTVHAGNVNAAPGDLKVLESSQKALDDYYDMQFSPEEATAHKAAASMTLKSQWVISAAQKNPLVAMEQLNKWFSAGQFPDAAKYASLRAHLESKGDEQALDSYDMLAKQKGYSAQKVISILADPVRRAREFPGITLKQAEAFSNVVEGRERWRDYQDRQARADAGEAEFTTILKAFDSGDMAAGQKLMMKAKNMNSSQRSWLSGYFKTVQAEEIAGEQNKLFANIENGTIVSPEQLAVASRPLLNSGEQGVKAANTVKAYFSARRADDTTSYALADRVFKNAARNKIYGFESTPADFMVYLRETCTYGNIHGDAIVKKAQELIGTFEDKTWPMPNKVSSPYREAEKRGEAGPNKKPQKPAAPATKKPESKLKSFDPELVQRVTDAIKNDHPGRKVTEDDILKVIEANAGKL